MTTRKASSPDLISRRKALARIGLAAGAVYVAPVLLGANAARASGASGGGNSGNSGNSGGNSRGNSGPSRGFSRGSRPSGPSRGARNGQGPIQGTGNFNTDVSNLLNFLFP